MNYLLLEQYRKDVLAYIEKIMHADVGKEQYNDLIVEFSFESKKNDSKTGQLKKIFTQMGYNQDDIEEIKEDFLITLRKKSIQTGYGRNIATDTLAQYEERINLFCRFWQNKHLVLAKFERCTQSEVDVIKDLMRCRTIIDGILLFNIYFYKVISNRRHKIYDLYIGASEETPDMIKSLPCFKTKTVEIIKDKSFNIENCGYLVENYHWS